MLIDEKVLSSPDLKAILRYNICARGICNLLHRSVSRRAGRTEAGYALSESGAGPSGAARWPTCPLGASHAHPCQAHLGPQPPVESVVWGKLTGMGTVGVTVALHHLPLGIGRLILRQGGLAPKVDTRESRISIMSVRLKLIKRVEF